MIDVYLDLETIPCQDPAYRDEVRKGIKPPGNIKKADSIAQWMAENAESATDEAVAKTSFDPAHGHICTIGFAIGDAPARTHSMFRVEDEAQMLGWFFEEMPQLGLARIIGHNVAAFDLRFLLGRAVILGVPIPKAITRDIKPWSEFVFDTMTAFAGNGGKIGLDRLAKAMGFGGKGDFDGSMVADAWLAGEHEKIAAYCRDDVELVRKVHKRFETVNF